MSGIIGDNLTPWGRGGLFNPETPKPVKAPPVPPPEAIPDVGPDTGEQARRRRPRGRQQAIITGSLVPETDKKKVLG